MTKFTINPQLDIATLTWVGNDGVVEYEGPVVQFKKGREQMGANAAAGAAASKQQNANSQQSYDTANKLVGEETASTTPGSLSPAATAQLASDTDNISRTYNGMRQAAFATLGQRGMGNAPSGFQTAASNGLNVGQEGAQTGAYRNAQVQTQAQRQDAEHTAAGLSGQQGSLGASNLGQSTNAAVAQNHAGSTAGDILGGIASVAPIVAAPFTGGASLLGSGVFGNTNPFAKIGKTTGISGVGNYSPSGGPAA